MKKTEAKVANPDIDLIDFQPAKFLAFRDMEVCKKVARIPKEKLCRLPRGTHPQFKARIAPVKDYHFQMALDMLVRIKQALDEGKQFVGVFPTGPIFQYQMLADMVNALRLPLHHVHYFSMDEYADEDGRDINPEWPGSFHYTIEKQFLSRLDPKLRIPAKQMHFPSSSNINHYDEMIVEARQDPSAKGADIVYGGTGLSGHYSFWDPHLAQEYGMDHRGVEAGHPAADRLPPHLHGADGRHRHERRLAFVPPKAYTTASTTMLNADFRSWWNDGAGLTADGSYSGGIVWQKFITRLVLHGPDRAARSPARSCAPPPATTWSWSRWPRT